MSREKEAGGAARSLLLAMGFECGFFDAGSAKTGCAESGETLPVFVTSNITRPHGVGRAAKGKILGSRQTGGVASLKRRWASHNWSDPTSCQNALPETLVPGEAGLRRVARPGALRLGSKGTSTELLPRQALTERAPDARVRAFCREEAVHRGVDWRADRSNGFEGIREAGHA